jgi:predicted metal-dependent hydrolase
MPPIASPSPGAEVRVVALELDGLPEVTVVVRRNPRARHVRLRVDDGGVVTASVPKRFALRRLDPIVRERGEWLRDVITRMQLASQATEVDLRRGDPVRLLGRWHPVRLVAGARPRGRIDELSGTVELTVPSGRDPYDVLERWYREEARRLVAARVQHWADSFGLRYGNLSIRDQRTRWGSCSHRADLSFNWRLVLAPLWVLDAIVVHELCHIEELNHSDRFWALVHTRYPEHDAATEWLRTHGPALRITRPSSGARRIAPAGLPAAPHSHDGGAVGTAVAMAGTDGAAAVPATRSRARRARQAEHAQESLF